MTDSTNPYSVAAAAEPEIKPSDIPRLDPPQSVRYEYTAELLQALWLHRTLTCKSDVRNRRRARWQVFGLGFLLAIATALLLPLPGPEDSLPWIGVMILSTVSLSLMFLAFRMNSKQAISAQMLELTNRYTSETENRHLLAERTVTFEADGIREQQSLSHSFTRWSAIERIDRDEETLFIYNSSISAFIIPRTAFATQVQFLAFANLAEQLWGEYRSSDTMESN